MPSALTIIASVAMKGCSRPLTMNAPLIAPSISAKHGVTSRTAEDPEFRREPARRRTTATAAPAARPSSAGMRQAAPRPQHDLAPPPRLDVATAREAVEDEPREKADRRARPQIVAAGTPMIAGGRPSRPGQQHRADDRRTAHDRADRQIDAAEQDDDGHAGRDEAGDRHLPQHVGQIAVGEEDVPARGRVRRGQRADQADERQAPIELGARQKAKRDSSGGSRRALAQARRREAHDGFLGRLRARENAGLAPFAHHQNPVRQQQQLRHLRAHGHDAEARAPQARRRARRSPAWRRRRCRASARRAAAPEAPSPATCR